MKGQSYHRALAPPAHAGRRGSRHHHSQMARQATDVRSLRGAALESAKRRFQEIFPGRFADESYLAWERDYKWEAHLAWLRALGHLDWQRLHGRWQFDEIATRIGSFYAHSKLGLLAHYE